MISEQEGCAHLTKLFRARGYRIEREVPFHEGPVTFELDGWDAARRVGFEYLVRSEGDHDDLDANERAALGARMQKGELYVLIVDEAADKALLTFAANGFLDEVARRTGRPASRKSPRKKKASKKKASKKRVSKTRTRR